MSTVALFAACWPMVSKEGVKHLRTRATALGWRLVVVVYVPQTVRYTASKASFLRLYTGNVPPEIVLCKEEDDIVVEKHVSDTPLHILWSPDKIKAKKSIACWSACRTAYAIVLSIPGSVQDLRSFS